MAHSGEDRSEPSRPSHRRGIVRGGPAADQTNDVVPDNVDNPPVAISVISEPEAKVDRLVITTAA